MTTALLRCLVRKRQNGFHTSRNIEWDILNYTNGNRLCLYTKLEMRDAPPLISIRLHVCIRAITLIHSVWKSPQKVSFCKIASKASKWDISVLFSSTVLWRVLLVIYVECTFWTMQLFAFKLIFQSPTLDTFNWRSAIPCFQLLD